MTSPTAPAAPRDTTQHDAPQLTRITRASIADAAQRAREALERTLDTLAPGWDTRKDLMQAAADLSAALGKGDVPAVGYVGARDRRAAYLAYFGPRSIAAVARAAESLIGQPVPRHVVDVGAGSGTGALFFAALGTPRLSLVDADADALELACRVVASAPGPSGQLARVTTAIATPGRLPRPASTADVLLSTFALGELQHAVETTEAVHALLAHVAPAAHTWLVIDAGDRFHGRGVQELRHYALEHDMVALGPCPHQHACPALDRARDWCHLVAPRELTERLHAFAEGTGRDPGHMALSAIVLGTTASAAGRASADAVLVLGDAKKEKGRVRVPVCGSGGARFMQALKRHKDAYRALLKDVPRGAVLERAPLGEVRGDQFVVETAKNLRILGQDAEPRA